MAFGFGSSRRFAGDRLLGSIDLSGNADPYTPYGMAGGGGGGDMGLHRSSPVNAGPTLQGPLNLKGAADEAASMIPFGQRFSEGATRFVADNRKLLGRGALGLGALGLATGAAGELSNPDESRLNNLAGAAGTVAGGGIGAGLGAAIGTAASGAFGPLAPIAAPVMATIGANLFGSAGNAAARTIAGAFESPAAAEQRARERERSNMIADLEARLPIEADIAEMRNALQQRALDAQFQRDAQLALQRAGIEQALIRSSGQQQQNALLTQGMMANVFGA